MTKAEIAENVGGCLGSIEGTITRVYECKAGESEHGPWSFQGAKLKLPNGDNVDIKFKNFPDDQKFRLNKKFHAKSTLDGKKRKNGLNVEMYKDNPQVIVNFEFAEIIDGQASTDTGNQSGGKPPRNESAERPASKPVNDEEALKAAIKFVAHNRTLAIVVLKATASLEKEYIKVYGGTAMPEQVFCTVFNTLIFGADRALNLSALPTNIDFATLKIIKPTPPATLAPQEGIN